MIFGDDLETSVYAVGHSEDGVAMLFRFRLDPSRPASINSRIMNCLYEKDIDNLETYPDMELMQEAVSSAISQVWESCVSDPSASLPDTVVDIQEDGQGRLLCNVTHEESSFQEYVEALKPVASVQHSITPNSKTNIGWISFDSLQWVAHCGGRGNTSVVRVKGTSDNNAYVYKGLSFSDFLASKSDFHYGCQAFHTELDTILRLPDHPNLVRPPPMLVTIESVHDSQKILGRSVCGLLHPYLKHGSLQEVIDKARKYDRVLPLSLKAKWASQISSAMAAVHSAQMYHMDLKPPNILLDENNDAVLIDWEQLGAATFFAAPEVNGKWDVELVPSDQANGAKMGNGKLHYKEYKGTLPERDWAWPPRDVFRIWQRECPRALEAAETYSLGRTLWVIFEQVSEEFIRSKRGEVGVEYVMWNMRGDDIPTHWKDFIARATSQDPNERGTFSEAAEFWQWEEKKLGNSPQ